MFKEDVADEVVDAIQVESVCCLAVVGLLFLRRTHAYFTLGAISSIILHLAAISGICTTAANPEP